MEPNGVLRNGKVRNNNLTAAPIVKNPPSLTPSEEVGEDGEEEGQVTPLPGSTVELDVDSWPTDDEYQVRMTVIPSVQDEERRKSRYSTYYENRRPYIPHPDNHLYLAITALFCCFLPLGLVGFICALQVDKEYDEGNRESAVRRSRDAKYWSLSAIVFGLLGIVGASFYLIFFHLVPAVS